MKRGALLIATWCLLCAAAAAAAQEKAKPNGATAAGAASAAVVPPGYVIGPDDVLSITFWREADMTVEATVRPDGKVSLPLLNDVHAAGLTPAALRDALAEAARKYMEDPNPTVIVKTINSRKVFVVGQVEKPGPYPLNASTTVLQVLAMAGGLRDFARAKNITVLRNAGGASALFKFNYQDVLNGRHLEQNIELKPGDTVIVP